MSFFFNRFRKQQPQQPTSQQQKTQDNRSLLAESVLVPVLVSPTAAATSVDLLRRSEEGVDNYKPGGYHPVVIGDIFRDRYRVTAKVGWGHFSTVWKAEDSQGRAFALKVQKSGSAYAEAAVDEIKLLQAAGASHHVVRLYDFFQISGPNGIHHCMVFELLGENLLSLIKHFSHSCSYPDKFAKGIPVHIIKLIVRDVLKGLDFLHLNCRVIHTDLKPENVLLSHPMQESLDMIRKHEFVDEILPLVKIVDLGNACWTYKHFTDYITTRQYRSPEAIVEFEYSTAVDIWSLACITFELITGEYLFDPRADKNGAYSRDEDHLALMIELLGEAPDAISKLGRSSSKFFSKDGSLRNIHDLMHWPIDALLYEKHDVPKAIASEISSFLSPMLQMDPLKRATAAQCLEHEWLSDFQVSVALDEEKQKTNSGSKVLSGLARLQPSGFHSRSVPVPANNHKAGGNSSKYMKI